MTDPDMSMFIDNSLIGAYSRIQRPYAKANNPQCPDYNPLLQPLWILYMDANNLYGYAMRLPHGWMLLKETIGQSSLFNNMMNREKDTF